MSFFVSIIPFEHSIGITPLLYRTGDIDINELSIGQIVEIPYGVHLENGIIAEIFMECPIDECSEAYTRMRSMGRIMTDKTILASYQIDMIIMIASRYMIPIHRVLAIFLTRPILSRLEKKNYEQIEENDLVVGGKGIGQIHIVQDSIVTPILIDTYTQGQPTVVIVPDDYAMMPYRQHNKDREDILFVSSDMTDVRKAQAWIDITNKKFSIIYGTRRLIYYNLSHYSSLIYVEDSLGPDYWHYPIRIRYNDILHIFAIKNPNKNITILTSIPTLTSIVNFRNYLVENISALGKKI